MFVEEAFQVVLECLVGFYKIVYHFCVVIGQGGVLLYLLQCGIGLYLQVIDIAGSDGGDAEVGGVVVVIGGEDGVTHLLGIVDGEEGGDFSVWCSVCWGFADGGDDVVGVFLELTGYVIVLHEAAVEEDVSGTWQVADDSGEGAGVHPYSARGDFIAGVPAIGVGGTHGGGDGVIDAFEKAACAMTAEDEGVFIGGVFGYYPLHDREQRVGVGGDNGIGPFAHLGALAIDHLSDVCLLAEDIGEDDDIGGGRDFFCACLYLADVAIEV